MSTQYAFASQQGIATLYKFRSFDPDHPEYVANIFTRQELHFPAPSSLNDPFECKPLIYAAVPTKPTSKLRMRQKIRKIFKMHDVPRDERRRRSRISEAPEFMKKRATEMTNELPAALDEYRLCSFSNSRDSLLMWAHYANSHTGICLEFDAKNKDFGSALKVEYSATYPVLEFFDDDPAATLQSMILTKSEDWFYEKEFRLVTRIPPLSQQIQLHNDKFTFQHTHLTGVILGCQISDENEAMIRGFVAAYPSPLTIKRAVRSTSKFSLDFVTA